MSIVGSGKGQKHYRCKHRGEGCKMPYRSNEGLLRAAGRGLALLCDDTLREAIQLHEQRRKLLQLHYDGHISGDQFGEEQARLTIEIDNLEADANAAVLERVHADDTLSRFEELLDLLDRIDIARIWDAATESERRTLLDELLSDVTANTDRLTVNIHGAVALNVASQKSASRTRL